MSPIGKIDSRTHDYLSDNRRFADLVNYFVYDGEQIVDPKDLEMLDPTEIVFPYKKGKPSDIIHKFRDVLKKVCIKYDGLATYLIIGIENQAEVQYAMPVRNMLYDSEQYAKQVSAISKHHKDEGFDKSVSSGEFLSGFCKDDKIHPVITIVVFWSAEKWDGPLSLHDMIYVKDERIMRFVSDYKINLIAPYNMNETDFDNLHTALAEVFKYIKYSGDKQVLKNVIKSDKVFSELDRETADLINDVTGSDLIFKDRKVIDMCIAHEEMKKEAIEENSLKIAGTLLMMGKITIDEIAMATDLPVEVIKDLADQQV